MIKKTKKADTNKTEAVNTPLFKASCSNSRKAVMPIIEAAAAIIINPERAYFVTFSTLTICSSLILLSRIDARENKANVTRAITMSAIIILLSPQGLM